MTSRSLARVLAALSALALGGCQSAFFSTLKVPTIGQQYQSERIEFSATPKLAMDVYRPRQPRAMSPTVVFLYGGSWQNGKRSWYRFVGASLAELGVVVAIPDYRKSPEIQFPVFIQDAASAVAYVNAHIGEFGGDRQRLFVVGHSAGAQMAALLATDSRYLQAVGMQPQQLTGVASLSGPLDFLPLIDPKIIRVFNGDAQHHDSQPIHFVDGDEPPMLLLHGSDDRLVYPRNSEHLHQRLQAVGISSTLKIYPGVGHMGVVMAFSRGFRHLAPVLTDVLDWINHFPVAPKP